MTVHLQRVRTGFGFLNVRQKSSRAKITAEKFLKVPNMVLCISTFKVIPVHGQNLRVTELLKERSKVLQADVDNMIQSSFGITIQTFAVLGR